MEEHQAVLAFWFDETEPEQWWSSQPLENHDFELRHKAIKISSAGIPIATRRWVGLPR